MPWLPLSVIRSPGSSSSPRVGGGSGDSPSVSERRQSRDGEANLNALLGTLGPSGGHRPATTLGEAIGGTVRSERLEEAMEEGEAGWEEEGGGEATPTIQLQRVAPRCHCQVIYVTYGDQVEAEITRSSSPGRASVSSEVKVHISRASILTLLCSLVLAC